jgi:hypothetical protein
VGTRKYKSNYALKKVYRTSPGNIFEVDYDHKIKIQVNDANRGQFYKAFTQVNNVTREIA